MLWYDLASGHNMNEIRMALRNYYWVTIENIGFQSSLEYKKWNDAEIFDIYKLEPVLQFNHINKFPKKRNTSTEKKYINYQVVSDDQFSKWTENSLGIKSTHSGITYRVYNDLQGLNIVDEYLTMDHLKGKYATINTISARNNVSVTIPLGPGAPLDIALKVAGVSIPVTSAAWVALGAQIASYLPAAGIGVAVLSAIGVIWGIAAIGVKYDDFNKSKNLYNKYLSQVNGVEGLKKSLDDINEYLEYVEKNNIELDPELEKRLRYNESFLRNMYENGEDYWIDMQIEWIDSWMWWIPPIPWPWPWVFGKMTKGAWWLSIPFDLTEGKNLLDKFDPNFSPPPIPESTVENPLSPIYKSQWEYFYDWISIQKFMGNIDNIENNSFIIDNAISNMQEIYKRSLVTNIITEIETNENIIVTNMNLLESPITDNNKNQYFEKYVNNSLNNIVEERFGSLYKLDIFKFNL